MNSAGCSGAADMSRSDVLHRSSSAPVCFTGKPAAVLRLLGMAKPPLPSYLQIAGKIPISACGSADVSDGRSSISALSNNEREAYPPCPCSPKPIKLLNYIAFIQMPLFTPV